MAILGRIALRLTGGAVTAFLLGDAGCRCAPKDGRPPQSRPIRIAFLGDTQIGQTALRMAKRDGADRAYRLVRPHLGPLDLMVANLEVAITRQTQFLHASNLHLKSPPEGLGVLRDMGISVVSLSNNHAFDYGPAGFEETLAGLARYGLKHYGAGRNLAEASQGLVLEIDGVRIGLLGFMYGYSTYTPHYFATESQGGVAKLDRQAVRCAIQRLRPKVDVLIVSCHWGRNNRPPLDRHQTQWGRWLADQGADWVVGHGPHLGQGAEVRGDAVILYSIGNFIFGTPAGGRLFELEAVERSSWVATATIENRRIREIELLPIVTHRPMVDGQPRPLEPEKLPEWWSRVNVGLNTAADIREGRVHIPVGSR